MRQVAIEKLLSVQVSYYTYDCRVSLKRRNYINMKRNYTTLLCDFDKEMSKS